MMAQGSQNLTTYIAKRIIGDSTNVNWDGALLHSGTGGKTSVMDTWIFADDYGSVSSTYGILHRQSNDKIVFVGASADRFWNDLNSGDTYIGGKLGIEYNPETSENTYKLYVNGTSYLNGELSVIGTILEKNGSICIDNTTTDLTASDNGSSSTIYHSIWGRDKANRSWFCVEGYTNTNGSVAAFLGVRNYNTSGTAQSWKGITITEAKDNTLAYTVSDPTKFITAIMGDSDSSKFYRGDKTWANTLHNVFYIHRDTTDWKTGAQLQFNVTKDNTSGYSYIAAYQTPTATTYNQSLVIVATGSCFIGGGEGAETIHQFRADSSGTEDLFLCPDGSIRIYTGADAKTQRAVIDSTPSFYPATTNTGNLGTSSYRWATLYSGTGNFTGDVTVAAGKRVGASGGALYLGNSGNQSWVYVQDMCSQDGQKWKIHQNGNAEFNGTVTAPTFSGNSTTTSKLLDSAHSWTATEVYNYMTARVLKAGDTMTGCLSIKTNNNQGTDALLYIEQSNNNDWGIKVNKTTSYDYGIQVTCATTAANALKVSGRITGTTVYGAVWNDYAEFRKGLTTKGGICVYEQKNSLTPTIARLQAGCRITSDTFGFAIGETEEAQTPIAVCGRVLVYPYVNRQLYQPGDAVCSAPNGTVDIMTREEIHEYPERIVGVVSEIPNYEIWHAGAQDGNHEIQVNGRIWIYVR